MNDYRRIYAAVDLDAIRHNMDAMKAGIKEGTAMMAVVKADGYGHGAVPVAQAVDAYVWGYGTATVEEAVILRRHGIEKPILVLGIVPAASYETLITYDIRPAVFQYEKAECLSEMSVRQGKRLGIHLAVDTGMSRIGFEVSEAAAEEAARIAQLPGIYIEGMFTHFARADEADKRAAQKQIGKFRLFVDMLAAKGIHIPVLHCSNSAGILEMKEAGYQLVRAGISMYGLYPSDEVGREVAKLEPALSLKSTVTYVKRVKAGTSISYGGTYTSDHDMDVATIPAGYGDGYPRNLSNRGYVLIRGKRARILGRVCMDQMMADVTEIPGVREDDTVTLIGKDGSEEITVEELAELSGGFHYEILCDIGKRVPRVYMDQGAVIGTIDYFQDSYEDFKTFGQRKF